MDPIIDTIIDYVNRNSMKSWAFIGFDGELFLHNDRSMWTIMTFENFSNVHDVVVHMFSDKKVMEELKDVLFECIDEDDRLELKSAPDRNSDESLDQYWERCTLFYHTNPDVFTQDLEQTWEDGKMSAYDIVETGRLYSILSHNGKI